MGFLHENGLGGFSTDINQARECYREAAAADVEDAKKALGLLGPQSNSESSASNPEASPVTTPGVAPSP
jgi:hypothetical protein